MDTIGANDGMSGFDNEFITEIRDDLELLEPDLLAMEKEGRNVDSELINRAFRSIHSIKGGAGFCGLKDLGTLSHSMENVLMRIRDGRFELTAEIVDSLLAGFDKMKLMVEAIDASEIPSYKEELRALETILTDGKQPEKEETGHQVNDDQLNENVHKESQVTNKSGTESLFSDVMCLSTPSVSIFKGREFFVPPETIEAAVLEGKYFYAAYFDIEKDILSQNRTIDGIFDDVENAGELVFSDIEQGFNLSEVNAKQSGFSLLVSTILDAEFLAEVLEIPVENVYGFDFTRILVKDTSQDKPEPQEHIPETKQTIKRVPSHFDELESAGEKEKLLPRTSPKETKKIVETIRVNVDLINRLMNLAGELVLSRNQLRPLIDDYAQESSAVSSVMQNLNMVTTEIQEDIMQIRMQPVGNLLKRFERIVRDMSRTLSKKVDLVIEGGDVELDKTVLEGLANPFTHLMRNCVDHGIEIPAERGQAGKPETGTIKVNAFHQGGNVHINIIDDGRGIDPEIVSAIAFKKGLITKAQKEEMTDKEKINLVFRPGFSTSDEITDLSGRGVGMDVVRTNIEQLRGSIDIESVPGEGTSVHIIIPLTLAIISALIVGTGEFKFAIPQVNLSEVVYLKPGDLTNSVESIGGSDVLRFRGKLLPVLRLRTLLNTKTTVVDELTGTEMVERRKAIADRRSKPDPVEEEEERRRRNDRRKSAWDAVYVVVLKVGLNSFGLCVEELFDNEEIVVKPLSEYIKDSKCFCGATILGDGSVIMILDAQGIANYAGLRFEALNAEQERRRAREKNAGENDAIVRSVIIFSGAEEEYFALDLNRVARLEAITEDDVHTIGSQRFMAYEDSSIPLFELKDFIPVTPFEFDKKLMHVIIPKRTSFKTGIIAHRIIDTMEIQQKIHKDGTSPEGVEGKTFIDGKLVQFLDMDRIIDYIEKRVVVTV